MLFFLRCHLPMPLIRKTFKRLHYPVDIIAQCVRWYLDYALSLLNLEEMMAERGVIVDHSTLHRWVIAGRTKARMTSRKSTSDMTRGVMCMCVRQRSC